MKKHLLLVPLLIAHMQTKEFQPNGYCNIILADLLGAPIKSFFNESLLSTKDLYKTLPYDDQKSKNSCPRIGQLLYNDPVEILEYRDHEVKISTPQWQYSSNNALHSTYWTLAEYITPLTKKNAHFHPNNIPFKTTGQGIITLHKPWYNNKIKTTYSVGTRFVLTPQKKENRLFYKVFYLDHGHRASINIPRTHCHKETVVSSTKAKKNFLKLLRQWALQLPSIAYVWGGGSYAGSTLKKSPHSNALIGFECGKIIVRAAQISGIPLYATNSSTLAKTLQPLGENDPIENGDIISFTGHVAIVSDAKKGLHIEARGYPSGHGIVHEIPLHKQFKDIYTVEDLQKAYDNKEKIIRLNKAGEETQIINEIKLFKIA